MKHLNSDKQSSGNWFAGAFGAVQRRFRNARPGSVLIMVVALLVLLALIGTAAMSTARIDRASSSFNIASTEIDMVLEGARQMAISRLVNNILGPLPNTSDSPATDSNNLEAPKDTSDIFLASRHPERNSLTTQFFTSGPEDSADVVWRYISYPAQKTGANFTFDLPYLDSADAKGGALPLPKEPCKPTYMMLDGVPAPALTMGTKTYIAADADGDGIADSFYYRMPMSTLNGITYYYAWRIIDNNSALNLNTAWDPSLETLDIYNGTATLARVNLAGIFPGSISLTGDGNTYAQDEANLKFPPIPPPQNDGVGGAPLDGQKLSQRRFYGYTVNIAGRPAITALPVSRLMGTLMVRNGSNPPQAESLDGLTSISRLDVDWLTVGDMLHHQLGRRLDNPWFWNTPSANQPRFGNGFRPYGVDTAIVLANQFCLANRSFLGSSVVETELRPATLDLNGQNAPRTNNNQGHWQPYTADQVDGKGLDNYTSWYQQNFEVLKSAAPGSTKPILQRTSQRSFLTSYNPTRMDVVRRKWLYGSGIFVVYDNGGVASKNSGFFTSKANPNTANFEELHQCFYDIMSGAGGPNVPLEVTAYGPDADDNGNKLSKSDPYFGMKFDPTTFSSELKDPSSTVPAEKPHPVGLFRNSVRGVGGTSYPAGTSTDVKTLATLHPVQMMHLRSAIAAINTIALREQDVDLVNASVTPDQDPTIPVITKPVLVPHRVVRLKASTQPTYDAYDFHVFGVKRQPFITEVYYNNYPDAQDGVPAGAGDGGGPAAPAALLDDGPGPATQKKYNPRGFVAIKLYNPYDVPLSLKGYKIKIIERKKDNDTAADHRTYVLPANFEPGSTTTLLNTGALGARMSLTQLDALSNDAMNPNPFTFQDTDVIPAQSYLILSNYNKDETNVTDYDTAQYIPATIKNQISGTFPATPAPGQRIWIKTLHNAIGNEIVLMRPSVDIDDPNFDNPDPSKRLASPDAPVDSFDCTGLQQFEQTPVTGLDGQPLPKEAIDQLLAAKKGKCFVWHYARGSKPSSANNRAWHFVYPGRYAATGAMNPDLPDQESPHHQGTEVQPIDNDKGDPKADSWKKTPLAFGPNSDNQYNSREYQLTADTPIPLTSSFAIQIANFGTLPQFLTSASGLPLYPFRGFARTGDLLNVTFIGSYTVNRTGVFDRFIEVNAVPIDAAFGEDTDPTDDVTENKMQHEDIGRFAPGINDRSATNPGKAMFNDHYWFATRFFDYFSTIHSAAEDFLPNRPIRPRWVNKYNPPTTPDPVYALDPTMVRNASPTRPPNREGAGMNSATDPATQPSIATEDNIPAEGLININTANWKVLACLPLVPLVADPTTSTGFRVDRTKTETLARRIVHFRDVNDGTGKAHGPFRSIYELQLIKEFRTAEGTFDFTTDIGPGKDLEVKDGDWSLLKGTGNADATRDNVRWDYKEKYLNLTRIANLITVKSDTYTVYVQVQGWRDAGTANAKLVSQRRSAFILDRSNVTPAFPTPKIFPIPTSN